MTVSLLYATIFSYADRDFFAVVVAWGVLTLGAVLLVDLELFTTFVSGISHIKLKNVNKKLFINLVLPGIIGGVIGAYLLAKVQMKLLDIYIDIYLIIMGIIILKILEYINIVMHV